MNVSCCMKKKNGTSLLSFCILVMVYDDCYKCATSDWSELRSGEDAASRVGRHLRGWVATNLNEHALWLVDTTKDNETIGIEF